jgi:glyoxalase family protein
MAPLAELGRRVALPPWLEPRRAVIEAQLTPLPDPRAGWTAAQAGAGAGSIEDGPAR